MKRLTKMSVAFALLFMANGAFAQDYNGSLTGTTYGLDDNTDAGTEISNTATVNYEVGGVAQAQEINDPAAKFVVDRVILLNVASSGDTTVAPDEDDAVLTFTVTNSSNDTLDIVLETSQLGGDFDATGLTLYRETGTTPGFDSGTDLTLTAPLGSAGILLLDMSEEEVATIYVVGDIPTAASITDPDNGATDDIILRAVAYNNVGTPLPGDIVVETNTTTSNEVDDMIEDTVFGDLAGDFEDTDTGTTTGDDIDEDGEHSATGSFIVGAATITVTKESVVLEDPFNGTTNPKAIPGAEVMYCIEVANSGGTDAENVSVRDAIPAGTTYVNNSILVFNKDITCGVALETDPDRLIMTDEATDTETPTVNGNSGDTELTTPETTDTVVNTTVTLLESGGDTTATVFRVTIN